MVIFVSGKLRQLYERKSVNVLADSDSDSESDSDSDMPSVCV
jgi:hypothetical protein